MSLLWIYVFCSLVFRVSLGLLNPLSVFRGNKTENEKPKEPNEVAQNGTEESTRSPMTTNLFNILGSLNLTSVTRELGETIVSPFYNTEEDACYEKLGCFTVASPWKSTLRPIGAPMSPELINSSFSFFSRENKMEPITRELYPEPDLTDIPFNKTKTLVVVVHGFAGSGHANWIQRLKNAYLNVEDVNVLAVDWGGGAQKKNYLKVAGNTRVVGKELALLFKKLIDEDKVTPEKFHLIGHSLGAHICSYAAKEIPGIGRLTALDPAQPGFEGFHKTVRLDKSDAEFVEVYHTDAKPFLPAMGFGMMTPHGHVDFYFNGGFTQPGCLLPKINPDITDLSSLAKFPVEVLSEMIACPHGRSYEYFIESLNITCTFWGQKMQLFNSVDTAANVLTQGYLRLPHITSCSPYTCIAVGLSSIESPLRGSFMVSTASSPPYCKQ